MADKNSQASGDQAEKAQRAQDLAAVQEQLKSTDNRREISESRNRLAPPGVVIDNTAPQYMFMMPGLPGYARKTNFEAQDLNAMIDLVENAKPVELERAGKALWDARDALEAAATELQNHIAAVDWKGDGGTQFREYGKGLVTHARGLSGFADTAAQQITVAGTGLASVSKAMPPRDSRFDKRKPEDIPIVGQIKGNPAYEAALKVEKDRQEAINQMNRLSSFYAVSQDNLAAQEPPKFDQVLNANVPPPTGGGDMGGAVGRAGGTAAALGTAGVVPAAHTTGPGAVGDAAGGRAEGLDKAGPPAGDVARPGAAPGGGSPMPGGNSSMELAQVAAPPAPPAPAAGIAAPPAPTTAPPALGATPPMGPGYAPPVKGGTARVAGQPPMGRAGTSGQPPLGRTGTSGRPPAGRAGTTGPAPTGRAGTTAQPPMARGGTTGQPPMGRATGAIGQPPMGRAGTTGHPPMAPGGTTGQPPTGRATGPTGQSRGSRAGVHGQAPTGPAGATGQAPMGRATGPTGQTPVGRAGTTGSPMGRTGARADGIVGGNAQRAAPGSSGSRLPHGTVVGSEAGAAGRGSAGRIPASGAVGASPVAGTTARPTGRPAAGANGVVGTPRSAAAPSVRPGTGGFTQGGAGLVRGPASQRSTNEPEERDGSRRPDYLTEDEVTWTAGRRGTVPRVID